MAWHCVRKVCICLSELAKSHGVRSSFSARSHTSCTLLSLLSSPSVARIAPRNFLSDVFLGHHRSHMRRHIMESHFISPHHHPVCTASGSPALPCAHESFTHSLSVAVSVDAGSAIIHVWRRRGEKLSTWEQKVDY